MTANTTISQPPAGLPMPPLPCSLSGMAIVRHFMYVLELIRCCSVFPTCFHARFLMINVASLSDDRD